MSQSLTIPLAAGRSSVTVAGSFGDHYAVFPTSVTPAGGVPWLTEIAITDVQPTFWTADFSIPVPPGGATLTADLDSTTLAPQGATTLQDYLDDTRRLLRDELVTPGSTGNLYSTIDLTAFINRALQQRDLDLGLNRIRILFPLVVNQYAYQISDILANGQLLTGPSFGTVVLKVAVAAGNSSVHVTGTFQTGYTVTVTRSWLTAVTVEHETLTSFDLEFAVPAPPGGGLVTVRIVGATSTPVPNVIDLLSVVMTPLGTPPAGVRVPLGRWPYSRLAYLLSTSYPTYPQWYAMYGATGTVMVAPPPAAAYPAEWDFFCYASPLTAPSDADPLPYPWTDPIPFWAAKFAKLSVQRFDEADEFEKQAMDRTRRVMARGRPIAVQNPWFDLPRNAR